MTTDITELLQREKFEAWVMTQICISKSTLEGLRVADGYRDTTLSGTDYNRMWAAWKAAGAELVEALEKAQSAKRTLESLGYTDNGGELWKPPIGPKPNFCLMDSYRHRIEELENDEVRQHLANAEHQLHIAELAKNNLRASRNAQFRKRKAAEKRIAELVEVLENTHAENELVRGQLFIAGRALLNQQAKIAELEEAEQKLCAANVTLDARAELAERRLAERERANAAQDDHINQQQDRIDILEKRNAELGKHVGMLEKRLKGTEESLIASTDMVTELESRTVKLPKKFKTSMYGTSLYEDLDILKMLTDAGIKVETDNVDADVSDRNKPGMVVAVHINAGDFVKFRGQVYEVEETDFDDHDVTLWFVGGETLKCAAGCQIEVVSAPVEDE